MAQDSITTTVICSSLEQDYGYDKDNSVFLFYPSRPAFESSRHSLFPPYPTGFYNLPVFRNDRVHLPLPLRPPESVYSDYTAIDYRDEDFYGREGDVLRSMGYSHCFCLGLISTSAPNWLHPVVVEDFAPAPAPLSTPGNIFVKLWNKFLRR